MKRPYDTFIDRTRDAGRRQLVAVVCLTAVVFNILLGIALSFQPSRTDLAARALLNGWNVICSAGGLIITDADGHRVPDEQTGDSGHDGPLCLFCLPLSNGHAGLSSETAIPAPIGHTRLVCGPYAAVLVVVTTTGSEAWPRAPPAAQIA